MLIGVDVFFGITAGIDQTETNQLLKVGFQILLLFQQLLEIVVYSWDGNVIHGTLDVLQDWLVVYIYDVGLVLEIQVLQIAAQRF